MSGKKGMIWKEHIFRNIPLSIRVSKKVKEHIKLMAITNNISESEMAEIAIKGYFGLV